MWCNQPYNRGWKTNIGQIFIKFVKKHSSDNKIFEYFEVIVAPSTWHISSSDTISRSNNSSNNAYTIPDPNQTIHSTENATSNVSYIKQDQLLIRIVFTMVQKKK